MGNGNFGNGALSDGVGRVRGEEGSAVLGVGLSLREACAPGCELHQCFLVVVVVSDSGLLDFVLVLGGTGLLGIGYF